VRKGEKSGRLIGLLSRLSGGGILLGRLSLFIKLGRNCILAGTAATVVRPGNAAKRPQKIDGNVTGV